MTTLEMNSFIGRKGHIPLGKVGEVMIEVTVVDVKERWGSIRYMVRPVAGYGRVWVEFVQFSTLTGEGGVR
jgi:hypothetical protein